MTAGNITILTNPCPVCFEASRLIVPADGYQAWVGGAFIQTAFPELSVDDRELLISGTHPKCWDALMAAAEDFSNVTL